MLFLGIRVQTIDGYFVRYSERNLETNRWFSTFFKIARFPFWQFFGVNVCNFSHVNIIVDIIEFSFTCLLWNCMRLHENGHSFNLLNSYFALSKQVVFTCFTNISDFSYKFLYKAWSFLEKIMFSGETLIFFG